MKIEASQSNFTLYNVKIARTLFFNDSIQILSKDPGLDFLDSSMKGHELSINSPFLLFVYAAKATTFGGLSFVCCLSRLIQPSPLVLPPFNYLGIQSRKLRLIFKRELLLSPFYKVDFPFLSLRAVRGMQRRTIQGCDEVVRSATPKMVHFICHKIIIFIEISKLKLGALKHRNLVEFFFGPNQK